MEGRRGVREVRGWIERKREMIENYNDFFLISVSSYNITNAYKLFCCARYSENRQTTHGIDGLSLQHSSYLECRNCYADLSI